MVYCLSGFYSAASYSVVLTCFICVFLPALWYCSFSHIFTTCSFVVPERVLYMNLGTTRLRGRPRNKWQDEVREDGRIVGGEGWQEKVHNREEWKELLTVPKNRRILHTPME